MSENSYSKQRGRAAGVPMFGKVFASLYQGTLRGQAHEILVFTNLIAHADRDGYVDKHPRAIAEECGLSVDAVRVALSNLEQPDQESRSAIEEGRRLVRIDDHRAWGWRIVNYLKYREMRNEEARREQNRAAQARWRSRKHSSSSHKRASAMSAQAEAEAEAEATVLPSVEPRTALRASHASMPAGMGGGAKPARTRKPKAGPSYSESFAAAWKAYPHHGTRSSKVKAWEVWQRRGLDNCANDVLAWVAACAATDDWQRDGGQYVPGMEVWLKRPDFLDPPPAPERRPLDGLSEKGRRTAQAAQRLIARLEAQEAEVGDA